MTEPLSPLVWRCGWPNADALLRFTCPMKWEALQETDMPAVRFCAVCKRNVHLCDSPEQFIDLANRDECVALPAQLHVAEEVAALSENKLRADEEQSIFEEKNPSTNFIVGMPRATGPWDYPSINEAALNWWSHVNRARQQKTYSLFQQELSNHVSRIEIQRSLSGVGAKGSLPDGEAMAPEEKERLLQDALADKKLKEEYRAWEREQRRQKRESEKATLIANGKQKSRLP